MKVRTVLIILLLVAYSLTAMGQESSLPTSWLVKPAKEIRPSELSKVARAFGAELTIWPDFNLVTHLEFPYSPTEDVIAKLQKSQLIDYIEPVQKYYTSTHDLWSPEDPLKGDQWAHEMINLQEAHAMNFGSDPGVLVAVVDTGIAYAATAERASAPDLQGTVIYSGYDFVDEDELALDEGDGKIGHGTFLAGIIAQTTYNSRGTAGIAFNASLLPVRVADPDGIATSANLARGIYYSVVNGAQVILLGVAGEEPSKALEEVLEWAAEQGVVIVAPAGNTLETQFPAKSRNVISVGALDAAGHRAWYSPEKGQIDLYAPGGDLRKDVDANMDGLPDGILAESFVAPHKGNFFALYAEGTSAAAAHVAGVVALIVSQERTSDPARVHKDLSLGAITIDGKHILDAAGALKRSFDITW